MQARDRQDRAYLHKAATPYRECCSASRKLGNQEDDENIAPAHTMLLQLLGRGDRQAEGGQAPPSSHRSSLGIEVGNTHCRARPLALWLQASISYKLSSE